MLLDYRLGPTPSCQVANTLQDCQRLPCVQLIMLLSCWHIWVLSPSEFCHNSCFVTFLVCEFCHNLSFWVVFFFKFWRFVTISLNNFSFITIYHNLSSVITQVLSQFEMLNLVTTWVLWQFGLYQYLNLSPVHFFHNFFLKIFLSIVTIWVFKYCHNLSFKVVPFYA